MAKTIDNRFPTQALFLQAIQTLIPTFLSQLPACTNDIYEIKIDVELYFACIESFFVGLLQTLSLTCLLIWPLKHDFELHEFKRHIFGT